MNILFIGFQAISLLIVPTLLLLGIILANKPASRWKGSLIMGAFSLVAGILFAVAFLNYPRQLIKRGATSVIALVRN